MSTGPGFPELPGIITGSAFRPDSDEQLLQQQQQSMNWCDSPTTIASSNNNNNNANNTVTALSEDNDRLRNNNNNVSPSETRHKQQCDEFLMKQQQLMEVVVIMKEIAMLMGLIGRAVIGNCSANGLWQHSSKFQTRAKISTIPAVHHTVSAASCKTYQMTEPGCCRTSPTDAGIGCWDLHTGMGPPLSILAPPSHGLTCRRPLSRLLSTTEGTYIAGGGASGDIYLWQVATGKLLKKWNAHYRAVALLFNDDQSLLISEDRTCKVWSLSRGELLRSIVFPSIIDAIALDPEKMSSMLVVEMGKYT
ncbi:hypothetical protein HAX54_010018 [Datura stramonium]|uniref:Uncharacterized protein n=1 Tax=Datura stramonium TaxID=4076 RepID=A0ABS8TI98_DATST|nr:hypothetical protein [Datura stramonium]